MAWCHNYSFFIILPYCHSETIPEHPMYADKAPMCLSLSQFDTALPTSFPHLTFFPVYIGSSQTGNLYSWWGYKICELRHEYRTHFIVSTSHHGQKPCQIYLCIATSQHCSRNTGSSQEILIDGIMSSSQRHSELFDNWSGCCMHDDKWHWSSASASGKHLGMVGTMVNWHIH